MTAKERRQEVFNKYGGRCAYCGCELSGKWCIDHIEPVYRKTKMIGANYVDSVTGLPITEQDIENGNFGQYVPPKHVPDGFYKPERDTIENSNPSCFSCNHYKSTMSLETFRKNVGLLVMRLNRSFNQYKIAKRYGLIQETGIDVKFYFETLPPNP